MNKLLVICGPTATGKTRLGIDLAKELDGEIISADSRQVYRGMDIITGKELPVSAKLKIKSEKLQIKIKKDLILRPYRFDNIPVWLLDAVGPKQRFSVADYYGLAWKVIENIWQRGKLPILVGGTGFYVKAVLEGIGTMGIGPDWNLRSKLSNYQINELQIYLKKIDRKRWERMNESDRKNPRRLIRAIEVAKNRKSLTANRKSSNFDSLMIGLTAPYEFLYQRIDQRVEERVRMGAEEEVKKLLDKGYGWDNSVLGTTIGYREWRDFFEGKATKDEVIQRWKFAEHNYARRQMTWFKKTLRQSLGKWFDIRMPNFQEEVEKLVKGWYTHTTRI